MVRDFHSQKVSRVLEFNGIRDMALSHLHIGLASSLGSEGDPIRQELASEERPGSEVRSLLHFPDIGLNWKSQKFVAFI